MVADGETQTPELHLETGPRLTLVPMVRLPVTGLVLVRLLVAGLV